MSEKRRRKGWGGGSHWHSLTSLVLTCVQRAICRSGRQKDAPEPRRHSTGEHSFLSLMQIHTPIQRFLGFLGFFFFFQEGGTLSLPACLALFLSVHPRQADALESVEVERRLCFSVSQLFPEQVCESVLRSQSNPVNLSTLS